MIRYAELVDYVKKNHVNWNTDLFDVLKGFFEECSQFPISSSPSKQALNISKVKFKEPDDGEYSAQDLINLFGK